MNELSIESSTPLNPASHPQNLEKAEPETKMPLETRTSGGTSTHLTDAAKNLIIERILAGDTNAQINIALRTAKHISSRDSVSKQTLTKYRRTDAVRIETCRLTVEAIQVGHAAVSNLVLKNSEIIEKTREVLFPDGRFVTNPTLRHTLAARLFVFSSKFLWDVLWSGGALSESLKEEEKIREAARDAEDPAEISDAQRAMITKEVKQLLFHMLTDMVNRKRALDAENRQKAEAAATPETNG